MHDGEGEQHEDDVQIDEAEPVEETFPRGGTALSGTGCAGFLVRREAIGRGRVAVGDGGRVLWALSIWEVGGTSRRRNLVLIATAIKGIVVCGCALWA